MGHPYYNDGVPKLCAHPTSDWQVMDEVTPAMLRQNDFLAALIAGDEEKLEELVNTNWFIAWLPGGPEEGLDLKGLLQWFALFQAPFADFGKNVEYRQFIEASSDIIAQFSLTLTHTGPLNQRWGNENIGATGKSATLSCVTILTLDRGKITQLVMVADRMSVLEQVR